MEAITLGVQAGDVKSSEITRPHFLSLRKLLAQHCPGPYSQRIKEFAIILRIDGDIWHWEFEGCKNLRLRRKDRYITIDIGVPRGKWEHASAASLRCYLGKSCRDAIVLMLDKLKGEKIEVNSKALLENVDAAISEYLAGSEGVIR
jgi:hypothetical protein